MWATLWLTFALFVGTCYSQWINGPNIPSSCVDMQSGLFTQPQISQSPYTISVSSTDYQPSSAIDGMYLYMSKAFSIQGVTTPLT